MTTRSHSRWVLPTILALLTLSLSALYHLKETKDEVEKLTTQAGAGLDAARAKEEAIKVQVGILAKELNETRATLVAARDDLRANNKDAADAQAHAKRRESELLNSLMKVSRELDATRERADLLAKAVDPVKLEALTKTPAESSKEGSKARLQELLKRFERVSDDFTRPRVYRHVAFAPILRECERKYGDCGRCVFFNLMIDADGRVIFGGRKFNSLQVIQGDDIITFEKLEDLESLSGPRHSTNSELKCRLRWEYFERDTLGLGSLNRSMSTRSGVFDFTLSPNELKAIEETLELAKLFKGGN
ncbi:MAG: hypothetical protein RI910_877 [Verrucomicrobiota bacterium]